MEKNIKVRVTAVPYYDDIEEKKQYFTNDIRYLDYKRTRELVKANVITVMEIRRCKDD